MRAHGRRAALVAMVGVTAWSLWAWAQPAPSAVRREAPALSAHHREPHPPGSLPERATGLPEHAAGRPADARAARTPPEAEAAPEAKGEKEDASPPPMNWTDFGTETPPFIAMLINFGILVAAFYLFGRKPIVEGLQNRRDAVAKEIDEANRMKQEAEARAKTYQAKLEKLEEEASAAREALLRTGEAERDRIVGDAEAKAERMRRDAEFLLQQEIKQIRVDLWKAAVDAAVIAAAELLQQQVSPADQERLGEEYLAGLGGADAKSEKTGATGAAS